MKSRSKLGRKYSVILGNLGNTCDRFLSSGYKETLDKAKMIEQAASIEGVKGMELVGSWDVDPKSAAKVKKSLEKAGLECVSIIPDLFGQKRWGKGALASADKAIRKQAVEESNKMTDIAVDLGCSLVNLWPGQDGYDYALAADYRQERAWLAESLQEIAVFAKKKGVRVSLEYKAKEPRCRSYLAGAADSLLCARDTGLDNVGVTIDTGHAFLGGENVGESIALLDKKLFHMHFNDNHNSWDDDMIAGSVRLVEYFEALYWLETTGYSGWLSMDQYPYREDGRGAVRASVLFIARLHDLLERTGLPAVEKLVRKRNPVETSAFVRENLLAR